MQLEKFPLSDTRAFSSFFLDYVDRKEILKPFYGRYPTIENFEGQIQDKKRTYTMSTRRILHEVLQKQYQKVEAAEPVTRNINALLDENTFTVTTGHQLNIFTGPLYFIYKIVTVINACKALKKHYPHYEFVPVYWMASEDHDYDEIKYFRLFGKKYTWNTKQSGAVGRFSPLDDSVPTDCRIWRTKYRVA
jgi:bacillithiol synthase